jgi:Protein of unknown function (DUF3631)
VLLLRGIRDIFNCLGADYIGSADLVKMLIDLPSGLWIEWRGLQGNALPRPLTQATMAQLLSAFKIRPANIWPKNRKPGDKSVRGYRRAWFERAWASYCDDGVTPPQRNEIRHLRRE